jgi:hypothetical protein
MNPISSSLAAPAGALAERQGQLGRSLASLSGRVAPPAAPAEADDPSAADAPSTAAEIARQNQLSQLADSAAAASANRSAAAAIAAAPAAALAAQGSPAPETVLGLLSG